MNRIVREHYPVANPPADLRSDLIDSHVRIVIEREISDEDLRIEFEQEVVRGLADLDAGRVYDETEIDEFVESRFGRVPDPR